MSNPPFSDALSDFLTARGSVGGALIDGVGLLCPAEAVMDDARSMLHLMAPDRPGPSHGTQRLTWHRERRAGRRGGATHLRATPHTGRIAPLRPRV